MVKGESRLGRDKAIAMIIFVIYYLGDEKEDQRTKHIA